ncbi:iron complex outermembrane recepter protein [Tranquillimonas rosea]|uniref:Iron complex outermembrane recepter protein n=1 Tax=Tranquillimonas rosea TaxID=641238 RepID=A0A1H9PZW9_9RHOB|nr:TonB-dependent siderophore receptor [Tranquillimonas rosea]SER53688.1 iron complex outermembrane recepter protein [Tranquillimonas rosea]
MIPTRTLLLSGTALTAMCLPLAVAAQTTVLDTIYVSSPGEDPTGPVDGAVNPATETGMKTGTPLTEVPQSVSVVDSEELGTLNTTRASEALRYVPGVTTDVYGDDSDYDWHYIRGFQSDQTGVFWDGMQNLGFGFGSFYVDPFSLERIEVLRGPASVLYGGSNPGGLLNYVSKRPGERVRELTFGVNDAGRAWTAFDYGDTLDGGASYRFAARIEGGDTYDDFNDGLRGTFAPSFSFETDAGTEVTVLANVFLADEQHSGGSFLPYYGTVKPTDAFGRLGTETNYSDPDWDSYERRQATLTTIVEHDFANGWTLEGTGRLGVADIEESYYYPFGYGFAAQPVDDTGALSLIAFEHDTLVRTAQADLRLTGDAQTGAVAHELLFGLDARFWELDQTQASGTSFPTADPLDPVAPGTPELGDPYIDGTTRQRQVGVYAQDQLRFGAGWIATANLRHDWVSTETNGLTAFERDDSETSYRAGIAYEFDSGLVPYLSVSSFFLPTIASPAEGVTEPESGQQTEAGLKWAAPSGNAMATLSVFRLDRENVVTGVSPNLSQLGEVRSQGIELEGRYDFGNGLTVHGAATVLDQEITEDADAALVGNTPTLIPDRQIAVRADYAFAGQLDGLTLGAGLRYQAESWADEANTTEVPDATLVDLHAGYAWDNGWQGNLAVTNVADERYVTGCQDLFTCSYGAGREVSVTLSRKW